MKKFWTKEQVIKAAKKSRSLKKFRSDFPSAYTIALRDGYFKEVEKYLHRERKPSGFWTFTNVKKEAEKYNTKIEFRKKSPSAYSVGLKKGWLGKISRHMKPTRKESGFWTLSEQISAAKKCKTMSEFREKHPTAYSKLANAKNLDLVKRFLLVKKMPNGYWTKKRCLIEAKKYRTASDFEHGSPAAYSRAQKQKWLSEVGKHFVSNQKPNGFWNKKTVKQEAKKYATRSEFSKKSPSAYQVAHRLGIIDKVCKHMTVVGTRHQRALYAFEFPNKSVYVGLTYNYEKRFRSHMKNHKTIKRLTDEIGHTFVMYNEYYDKDIVGIKEQELIEKYSRGGWTILNKVKAGSLGGSQRKWDFESVSKVAKEYKTIIDFKNAHPGAYSAARKMGWLFKITAHMKRQLKPKGYWTKERCKEVAKKYQTRTEFARNGSTAYKIAAEKKWLDQICKHMQKKAS